MNYQNIITIWNLASAVDGQLFEGCGSRSRTCSVGWQHHEILSDYPELTEEDIRA